MKKCDVYDENKKLVVEIEALKSQNAALTEWIERLLAYIDSQSEKPLSETVIPELPTKEPEKYEHTFCASAICPVCWHTMWKEKGSDRYVCQNCGLEQKR